MSILNVLAGFLVKIMPKHHQKQNISKSMRLAWGPELEIWKSGTGNFGLKSENIFRRFIYPKINIFVY